MLCPKCQAENQADGIFCKRCGTLLPSADEGASATKTYVPLSFPSFSAGSTFAERYQIIEELGKGGMGVVYKVLDKVINERIVLKILRRDISEDEKMIERFRNELKLARKISHKNVCRMFDIGQDKGLFYITMECVSGEDLKSTLDRVGPLSVGKAIKILKQVCRGLAEAHRLGVIHRDLKPQNMIIGREGEVRILDFGIARSTMTRGVTETGMTIGTPEYMSPEQAMGEEVDLRSDIYSLGVVMFEMLTDTLPFRGETAVAIALNKRENPPPNPRSLNPQIPPDLGALILRCLEKDRNRRPASAEEVLEALERIERSVPTTESVVAARTTKSLKAKNRKMILIPAAAVAVIAALVSAYLIFKKPPDGGTGTSKRVAGSIGKFEVKATPAEAKIYIDGQDYGAATGKWDLTAGAHEIRVQAPRHQGRIDHIEIAAGKTTIKDYALDPFYYLVVKSKPDKASVYIDGTLMGTTPTEAIELPKNSCVLKIVKGASVSEDTVVLEAGKAKTVEWTLGQPGVAENQTKRVEDTAKRAGQTSAAAAKDAGAAAMEQKGQTAEAERLYQEASVRFVKQDYEQARESIERARALAPSSKPIADLAALIKAKLDAVQAEKEKAQKSATTEPVKTPAAAVPWVTLIDLPPELIQDYRERMSRINAAGTLDVGVGGQVELTLTVREDGRVEVDSFNDTALDVVPADKRESAKSAIKVAVQAIALGAPKDKTGRTVRVRNWRIGYSISRYQNRIILNVLT
jgi:serine/threonine protein kinase